MKFLIDFFPILLFFGAYKTTDIYTATAVLMAATVLQTVLIYKMDGKLQAMHKITLVLVLGFGALTLGLHDERFIKWKPTLLYTGLAVALGVAHVFLKKNFLLMLLGQQLELPRQVWHRMNISWMLYCLFMAAINGYVAAYYSTEDWVNFKLWGYAFPLIFIVGQGLYVARHLPKDGSSS
ncbi:septation protein A [Limnohabitans sp. T6-5]|uniref:septation protein A n=1 Tax=Limnohabitans sp. T6-5 TaxID=1100724 RepID=UPI000D33F00D|nr:septation protein A [Limnohabitans sp. T6-5]PUE08751.1 septation protein A [Limnohabitans sp. T6-5]